MSARLKSAESNSSVKKTLPATPTSTVHPNVSRSVTKLTRNVSKPVAENPVKQIPSSRLSENVTKKPVLSSKPLADGRASKRSVRPEALIKRAPKALDLQAQVNVLQEELKKVKDQSGQVAKEKDQVVDELKEAQKIAKETNKKLVEAVAVLKQVEEAVEMEKLRAKEIEESGIEAARIKQEIQNKETVDLRAQLGSNADSLQSVKLEMIRVSKELAEVSDAKNRAISKADEKGKESKCYSEKVEMLTAEIFSLKALIESKTEAAENDAEVILRMKSEIESLKLELEKSLASEEKMERKVKQLIIGLDESKLAQAYLDNLVKEWKQKVEELELQVEEANTNERSASESFSCATKKLEDLERFLRESEHNNASMLGSIAHSEAAVDKLHIELEASRDAEGKSRSLVEDLKQQAKKLHKQVEDSNLTEKTASDTLSAVKIQLETTQGVLEESNAKVTRLTEIITESQAAIEQVSVQLEASKMAEAYSNNLLTEWKHKVEELEDRVEEANGLEAATKKSLNLVQKELENTQNSSKAAEAEMDALEEKVMLLELSLEKHRDSHRQAEDRAAKAEADISEMAKIIETFKVQLEAVEKETLQALENENLMASNVQSLFEAKSKLINELENSRFEDEKSRKALESLSLALHEVSTEAREAKENFLARQVEHETYKSQIYDLKCILKETNEKYEAMLVDARNEVDSLVTAIEKSKQQLGESKAKWENSKSEFVSYVKKTQEEKSTLENEIIRLEKLVKEYEEGRCKTKSDNAQLRTAVKEAELEATHMQVVLEEAKAESMKLKGSLLKNQRELRDLNHMNEELRAREVAAVVKAEELSKLLEKAGGSKKCKNNGDTSNVLLVPEFEENQNEAEEKHDNQVVDLRLFHNIFEASETNVKKDDEPGAIKDSSKRDVVNIRYTSVQNTK